MFSHRLTSWMSQKHNFKENTSMDFWKVNIFIESCHNHAVNSLEALNFKMLSTETKMNIEAVFSSGLKTSQAYNEFLSKFTK